MSYLRVSREQVQAGFERYNLLDSRVFFHKVGDYQGCGPGDLHREAPLILWQHA